MKNSEIISSVIKYQKNMNVHPLTCGNSSLHPVLKPIEKNNDVILICEECDYTQLNIPGVVFMDLDWGFNLPD